MRASDLVKLDILVNGAAGRRALDDLAPRRRLLHGAASWSRTLRKLIPRQMFDVPVQASIGSRIIARETIRAMRKNVLAKCYGGDITRKRKLLEKQKEGKARMKIVGNVEIPQEAFMAVLSLGDKSSQTEELSRGPLTLTIVGLGPGIRLRTIAAQRALDQAPRILLRTGIHPGLDDLLADPRVSTCDDLYEQHRRSRRSTGR